MGLIAAFLRSKTAANVLMFSILGVGVLAATRIRRETFPSSDLDTLRVTAAYPGASADEVESSVLSLIEDRSTGVQGLKSLSGSATEGRASVTVELMQGTDSSDALAELREAVSQITTFPEGVEDVLVSEARRKDPVATLVVHGDVSEDVVRSHAFRLRDELVARRISTEVTVEGVRSPEIHITVSEARLLEHGVSLSDVAGAVAAWSTDAPLGTVRTTRGDALVRVKGQKRSPREFRDIPVGRGREGQQLLLGTIARISNGWEDVDVGAEHAGGRAAIMRVEKTQTQDTTLVARAVIEYLDEFRQSVPEGITVSVFADQSVSIGDRLGILIENGLLGLVLVFFVLLFFTQLRVAFWVTWGIPVVFLGTVFVMWVLGYTINMITMFGLLMVLGMLVDDAVVIAENIFTRRESGESAREASVNGTTEVLWPVIASSLTTVGAFLPLMFVVGQMGRTMGALPWVVIAALIASAAEAFLSMPKHLEHALKDTGKGDGGRAHALSRRVRERLTAWVNAFTESVVGPVARRMIEARYWVVGASIGLILITIGILAGGHLQFTFFPAPDTNSLVARVRFPVGGPLHRTREQVAELEAALVKAEDELADRVKGNGPLVERVLVRYGQTSVHTERGGHLAQIEVELQDAESRGIPSDDVIAAWRRHTTRMPGLSSLTVGRLERGVGGRELDIRLVGSTWTELEAASRSLKAALRIQDGVSNIDSDLRPGKVDLVLSVNEEGKRLGLTTDSLARQVRAAFYGAIAQRFQRRGDDVAVRVSYPPDHRISLRDLEQLAISLPGIEGAGARVRLSGIARIRRARGWAELTHLDRLRAVAVTADIDERVTTAGQVVTALRPFLTEELPHRFPGLTVRLEGQRATQRETFASLQVGSVVGLLVVIAVLVLVTDSWTMPIFVLSVIPFGLIGVVFGHLLMGYKLTMLGTMAAIGLAGVVINDAILVVEFYTKTRAEAGSEIDALVATVRRRFRPIVITSATTIAGLLPMLLETSIQAQFLIPMAITLAFGLLTGTLGTLVVLPCFLGIADDLAGSTTSGHGE